MPTVPKGSNVVQAPAPQVDPTALAMTEAMILGERKAEEWQHVLKAGQLYEDEYGRQRDTDNDAEIEKFRPQIDELSDSLTHREIQLLQKYHKGKYTDKEYEELGRVKEKAKEFSKDLPSSKFDRARNTINMYNWPSLFLDEIYRTQRRRGSRV